MTPFSPSALLAILLTFYPDVSAAAFAQARRDRPEYFAGGTIVGSHGDKLQLPDGRVWDGIYDVENATGNRHWQMIDVTDQGSDADPLFALEAGPLTPIDGDAIPATNLNPDFVPFVADALTETAGSDTLLASAANTIAEHSDAAPFNAGVTGAIDDGDGARAAELGAVLAAAPDDVLGATTATGGAIDGGEADAEFQPPPYTAPAGPGAPPDQYEPGPGDPYTDPGGVDHQG